MTKQEYERLSALVDNELPRSDISNEISRLAKSDESRSTWARYHLIGDAMRGELGRLHSASLAQEVSKRLESEPVVLAPRALKHPQGEKRKALIGLAVAASIGGAVVVLTLQMISRQDGLQPQMVLEAQSASPIAPDTYYVAQDGTRWEMLKKPEVESRLNAYLVNHQEHSPTSNIKGIMPYATFVSYDGGQQLKQKQ